MSKLSYICNVNQVEKGVKHSTPNGTYFFIRKKNEVGYHAYRSIENEQGVQYYVKVNLPKYIFDEVIRSGKMNVWMG